MTKILYFVTEDWAFCSHRLPVAREAQKLGLEVVVMARLSNKKEQIEQEGFRFIPLKINRGGKNPFCEFKTLMDIIRIYKAEKPDIVHHVALKPILYGGIASFWVQTKAVVNAFTGLGTIFTGDDIIRKSIRFILMPILKIILKRKNTTLIVQNDDDFAVFTKLGINNIVKIAGSGVDSSYYLPSAEPEGIIKVTLVARMLREKGVLELVEAARILQKEKAGVKIILVGDTDQANPSAISEKTLKAWHDEGIVEWQGQRKDILKLWQESHVAILPSWREGLPKSLLEAASCGRAMIASDAVGCRELVKDGINGLLVPLKSPEALAKAIKKLSSDKKLRQDMGKMARTLIETIYDEKIIAGKTAKVYKGLIGVIEKDFKEC